MGKFLGGKERGTLSINAREDTLKAGASSTWNAIKDNQRCLVPAQGFFEWCDKTRKPFFIHSPLLNLNDKDATKNGENNSGIWWYAGVFHLPPPTATVTEHKQLPTYSIITCDSTGTPLEWLHDRLPVILNTYEERALWLDDSLPFSAVAHLLKPLQSGMEWHEVDPGVGKIKNDSIDCIVPIDEKPGGLFKFLVPDVSNVSSLSTVAQSPQKRKLNEIDSLGTLKPDSQKKLSKGSPSKKAKQKSSSDPKITSFFTKK
ncbi:DUF159-domain-containing protein [Rhizoclosmatium globosum]|uniref:DUF159-domain-containing protein n=1 Tax=Rhizoclosmatium globosum TaxID=329046 RepID=A0A1Y2CFS5_9FUNG|nr:DUF159-domain-containing protein [Rhizoclosmatium globosum]|eukprot:ORY45900.1 DUF159-domain-containing protein [Rhizoclosmatium globosum]